MARKKKQLPILEKVTITDVAAEGKAIARVNDMVVFVPFVAPGDVVDIQLTRKKNSYAEGKPVYFHEYSAKRAEPFCEHFGVCGGCKWQHLPYEEQLYYKQKQVYDNLTRIGKVEMEEKLPILGSERTTFYRNKLEFTFSNKKWLTEEEIQSGASFDCMNGVGFHIPGMFDKVLDIHKCWLQDDISNKIRLCVKEYCLSHEGYPFFFDNRIKMPDGKQALFNYTRKDGKYRKEYDYMRGLGRGISTFRTTTFYQDDLWAVNDKMDQTDLRHSAETGNWMHMEKLKCNNPDSEFFGQNIKLYAEDDYYNEKNELVTRKGDLMCSDTIRRWYDVPHYIFCLNDVINQAKETNNGLEGATDGSIADWYLYRLAEAYLLRAEVKFYINPDDPTIKDDINIIRERAHCTEFYVGKVTIGDIMDERARELFFEEWRNVELTRVSLCLAISGRADEFGNTYKVETFDKQSGTDSEGGSYWYQRCIKKGMYNKGVTINVNATKTDINYIMGKHNIYWPIPEKAIVSNGKAPLYQNYGYDGYDPNVQLWETWQEAVADEDKF